MPRAQRQALGDAREALVDVEDISAVGHGGAEAALHVDPDLPVTSDHGRDLAQDVRNVLRAHAARVPILHGRRRRRQLVGALARAARGVEQHAHVAGQRRGVAQELAEERLGLLVHLQDPLDLGHGRERRPQRRGALRQAARVDAVDPRRVHLHAPEAPGREGPHERGVALQHLVHPAAAEVGRQAHARAAALPVSLRLREPLDAAGRRVARGALLVGAAQDAPLHPGVGHRYAPEQLGVDAVVDAAEPDAPQPWQARHGAGLAGALAARPRRHPGEGASDPQRPT
mmetsp:Transcript_108647/g.307250  ORF Transcript_108647/g.307250 Transcript_108647/m.307250 type:complete len:286 (+) Transcript_108647:172-1029(+)